MSKFATGHDWAIVAESPGCFWETRETAGSSESNFDDAAPSSRHLRDLWAHVLKLSHFFHKLMTVSVGCSISSQNECFFPCHVFH